MEYRERNIKRVKMSGKEVTKRTFIKNIDYFYDEIVKKEWNNIPDNIKSEL